MEMILFTGIPGSGKSTFYQYRFFHTHVRINLDMLRSRAREKTLFEACLAAKQPFVVDNTNVTREGRAEYIEKAKDAGFTVIGYFFEAPLQDALKRNRHRAQEQRVADVAIYAMKNKLEIPSKMEGFDELYSVKAANEKEFTVAGMAR